MTLKNLHINKNWTLFLDRDGVINKKLENDYVKHWSEFEFEEGVLTHFSKLNEIFGRVVVVTNQQGIGKRIYKHEDLELIHKNMLYELGYFKGHIDKVYYSPYLASENHPTRKPNTGMALQAKKDFPEIDFTCSIMVGDSNSDMQFAQSLGMKCIFIGKESVPPADYYYNSLAEFIEAL